MTPLILANARLVIPGDTEKAGSVRIEDGRIADIGAAAETPPEDARVIDCGGKVLAPGIVDLSVQVGEPGLRHKESYRSAGLAAAAGGVTTIVTQPDTDPTIDEPALLEFVHRRATDASPVRVLPMAALTKGLGGREMAEYQLLADAGAVAFTDADRPVADPVVFRRCMAYARSLNALVVHHAQDPAFASLGCATEGLFASRLGLPGVPAAAEAMMVERDLALVRLTGARYHIAQISTSGAIDALRRARDEGLPVSAGASIHHFALNEFDIADYRTFFKLDPPLRAENDRAAVAAALADGLIDVITSAHRPQDEESKRLPFGQAAAGAVGLETMLSAALRLHHNDGVPLSALFDRLSLAPSRLLGLETGRIAPGAPADLVLFDPDAPWIVDRFALNSKSKNTPFDTARMQGRVLITLAGGKIVHEHRRESA